MRNLRMFIPAVAAALLAAVLVVPVATGTPSNAKAKSVAFVGTYSGQASSKVDGNTAALAANGSGKGTLIGAGSIVGTGSADTSQQPCSPFNGTGTIKGAKGTILFSVASSSKGCGDEGGHVFSLSGYLTVTKATGALKKAKGRLKLTGVYDRDGGTFQIKLRGTLKK